MLGLGGQRKRAAGLVGVAFGRDGVAIARLQPGGRDRLPRLRAAEYLPGDDPDTLAEALEDWVGRHRAGRVRTIAVLAPGEYQLAQIEAPPVPAAEMRRAAAWRVRDLIDFPVDQAVVDTFEPPESTQRGQANINVAVAHRSAIAERVEQLREAGLELAAIDIPELAQGTVSEHLPDARGGHALLALDDADGLITVYRDGEQFLARTLDSGRARLAADADAAIEALLLEVQRSFDYFESALSQPPLGALYVYPPGDAVERFARAVEDNLSGVACRSIGLDDLVTVDAAPEHGTATLLRAVGAALRDPAGAD